MNCDEVRQHWNLYYDSEGDAELHFQINSHLDHCPACAEWFHNESRLEDLIVEKLRSDVPAVPTPDLWKAILVRSGVERPASTGRRYMLGGVLVAASLLVAAMLWNVYETMASPDLGQITADYHDQFARGERTAEFASQSSLEVEDYLKQSVNFAVSCPPRQDKGFLVHGAGTCPVDGSEAAYLVGQVEGKPVSIFILSRESLARFPHQQQVLLREGTYRCRKGTCEIVMAEQEGSVVLVVGWTDAEHLRRVLETFGPNREVRHG